MATNISSSNVIKVPRAPTTGVSQLVPLQAVNKLTALVGLKGEGLKTSDWGPGPALPTLPQSIQDRAQKGSQTYELKTPLAGAQGKVFALTVPDAGNGTFIGLFDQVGNEVAHVETKDDGGWSVLYGKSDSYSGDKPAAAAPGNVVNVPAAPTKSASQLLSLSAVSRLTQALGPQAAGLSSSDWKAVSLDALPKSSQDEVRAGSTGYQFVGDVSALPQSSGEIYVLKSPGTAYGAWLGLYDGAGTLAAHAQENDPVGWNLMLR